MKKSIRGISSDEDHTVNWAINNCKSLIQAVKYQQDTKVKDIMVKQATCVGQAFDEIEKLIPSLVADGSYNTKAYQAINLGDKWRKWIYKRNDAAIRDAKKFLDKWVPDLDSQHAAPVVDDDGDTNMSDDEPEDNSEIVDRVSALKTAYAALPTWKNPLPATWA